MPTQESGNNGLVVKSTLNFALDVGVFDFLIFLDDVFDLLDDTLEGPLGQLGGDAHIFLLVSHLYLLHVLHEVAHLEEGHSPIFQVVKHVLREVAVSFVFVKNSDFLNVVWHLGHDATHEFWDILCLGAAQNH